MKVLKLTLENVKKIKNETTNGLVKFVCDYVIGNWDNYDKKENIFLNVMNYGCRNGAVRELAYYEQTTRFYEDYKHEISELLYKSDYDNLADLFGSGWDKTDPLALEYYNRNLLAWFGFEETITNIAIKFGIE